VSILGAMIVLCDAKMPITHTHTLYNGFNEQWFHKRDQGRFAWMIFSECTRMVCIHQQQNHFSTKTLESGKIAAASQRPGDMRAS
jgi:hypothetical protein